MSKHSNLKVRMLVIATIMAACSYEVLAADSDITDGQGAIWKEDTSTLEIQGDLNFLSIPSYQVIMPEEGGNIDATKLEFLVKTSNSNATLSIDKNVGEIKTKYGLILSGLNWLSFEGAITETDVELRFDSVDFVSISGDTVKKIPYTAVLSADGTYRPNTSHTRARSSLNQIVGKDGSHIGKLLTEKNGVGFGISLTEGNIQTLSIGSSVYVNQVVKASIGDIGAETNRFQIGIFKLAKDVTSSTSKKIQSSYQTVNKVDNIYATEGGIIYYSGLGDSSNFYQHVAEVGTVDIDSSSSSTVYPVIAGISSQSGSSGTSSTSTNDKAAQVVGVAKKINVEGRVEHDDLLNGASSTVRSNIRKNNTNPKSFSTIENYIARAGISNFGGIQLIQATGETVSINVGSKNPEDLFNFAVLIYPELFRNITSQQNSDFVYTLPIVTTLEGNFDIENGNIAVLGLMPQHKAGVTEKSSFKNISSELKLQASSQGNTLRLGTKSKLFATNRRWSQLEGAFEIGSEGGTSSLTAGSGSSKSSNYRVVLPSSQNFLYVDGDFKGNATFVLGSAWNAKTNSIEVNETPLVFKNIVKQADGATHLNIDVDISASLPSDKVDKFDKYTALSVMNDAIQNLVIGAGKENLGLGGFDTASGTAIDSNFLIDKNLALNNPDATGVSANQRNPVGYVSLSTNEGLITPKTTYYTKYYLDDEKGTSKDINALLTKVEGEIKAISQSMYSNIATQSDGVPEDIFKAYAASGVGSVVSDKKLSQTFSSTENPPGAEDDPNKPTKDPESPDVPAVPDQPGESKPQKTTSTMDSIDSLGMANYFIWRQENETLYQRLGEVRDDPSARGLWVKVRGGRNKYSESGNYFKNQYYGVQLGVDRPLDEEWTLGAAASYTYGDGKLTNGGKDDNWIASGSLYALGAFDDGSYLDVVLRASRIHNDFTVVSDQARYITKGKRSGNAYSASVEYGQKIPLNPNWYVDPQIQVTYGHIQGLSFTTKNGVKVNTDRVNSLIGRVGVGVGYENAKGGAFVRADVLRDFTAQYKTNYALEKAKNNSDIDLRSTWGEISVGGNYQFDKNLHGYAQAKRSVDGKLKQDYRLDFGLRYVF
uniref:autotransporter outer membrane beta-barrel domain-containing protein n=1 Tax=Turicimonas muris TaxID=1796652 RepID=UPI00402AFF29